MRVVRGVCVATFALSAVVGFHENATEQSCQGVLLTLQNIMSVEKEHFRSDIWKQVTGHVYTSSDVMMTS